MEKNESGTRRENNMNNKTTTGRCSLTHISNGVVREQEQSHHSTNERVDRKRFQFTKFFSPLQTTSRTTTRRTRTTTTTRVALVQTIKKIRNEHRNKKFSHT
jgi:hypothetical protein